MRLNLRVVPFGCPVFVVAVLGHVPAGAADTDVRARFVSDATTAWDSTYTRLRHVHGVYRCRGQEDTEEFEDQVEYVSNSEAAYAKVKNLKSGYSSVYGLNPRYTFNLRSHPGRGWVHAGTYPGGEAKHESTNEIRRRIRDYTNVAEAAVRVWPDLDLLQDLCRAPGTRVLDVAGKTHGGNELIEVRLDVTPPTPDARLRSLVLLLDARSGWRPVRVVSNSVSPTSTGRTTADYEYAHGPDGLLVRMRKESTWTMKHSGKLVRATADYEFEHRIPSTLPDTREFTLSAFGLPEPVGVVWPTSSRAWLWFTFGAGAFFLVAAGAAYLHRRYTRRLLAPAAAS